MSTFLLIFLNFCVIATSTGNVSKCYFCNGECENPLEQITCRRNTSSHYGCITSIGKMGLRDRVVFKGCVDVLNIIDAENCKNLNEKADGTCWICETDLCNSAPVNAPTIATGCWLLFLLFVSVGIV